MTTFERWQLKTAQYAAMRAGIDVGIPLEYQLGEDGADPETLARLRLAQKSAAEQELGDGFSPEEQLPDPAPEDVEAARLRLQVA